MLRRVFFTLVAVFVCVQLKAVDVLTEAKVGYYLPTDARFRDVYSGSGIYTLETSVQAWQNLYPFFGISYFFKSGSSLGEETSTRIWMLPLNLGVKYVVPFQSVTPYVGAGLLVSYANIHQGSAFVTRVLNDWGAGLNLKLGMLVDLPKSFFLDFFSEYSYMKIDFSNNRSDVLNQKADLSGFTFGGGAGYRF